MHLSGQHLPYSNIILINMHTESCITWTEGHVSYY